MKRFIFTLMLLSPSALLGAAASQDAPTGYLHKWIALPELRGSDVITGDERVFKAKKDRMSTIIFLASWCEGCIKVLPDIKRLEEKHGSLMTDFLYVFSHDTREDAKKFALANGIKNAVISNQEILSFFHNPELPTVINADRKGWLFHRLIRPDSGNFAQLNEILRLFTAL